MAGSKVQEAVLEKDEGLASEEDQWTNGRAVAGHLVIMRFGQTDVML